MTHSPFRHFGSVLWKKRPIHLTFFVTKKCNSKCPFCFYLTPTLLNEAKKTEHQKELTLDEIRNISANMGSLLWLAFSGGEIYLRDDLVEISSVFYKNNKPAIMLYPTNGMMPDVIRHKTEEILLNCRKSIIAVKLSIDGLGNAHDILRNTPGSFEKTMQTYNLLGPLLDKYPNFELGINTVFYAQNQDSMDEIIDFVNRLDNIKTHTISLIRGSIPDDRYKEIDYRKYFHAVKRLEENLKKRISSTYRFRGARVKAAQDIMQRRLIHRTVIEHKRLIPCYAGRLNLVLTETGEVYPCEIISESLGNIRNFGYDLSRVLKSDKAQKALDSIKNNECFCTHECYFMTNILFNPALYPELLREYVQL